MSQFSLQVSMGIVSSCFLLAGTISAAELDGVVVEFEKYAGPATTTARSIGRHKIEIAVDPKTEREPLQIRVELPNSGRNAWPAADVEVRDMHGKALAVRRSGIEWHKLLFTVPAVTGQYFVQAVNPPGDQPTNPDEKERHLTDQATGLNLTISRWHDSRKAALSIRFDDSHPTHLSKSIPILDEYGFRGTFMINPGEQEPGSRRRSNFADHRAEWESVAQRGDHEFANHSAHHRGAIDDRDMEAEIGQAAEAIWELSPGKSKLTALNLGGGTLWETTRTLRYYLDKYHQFDASSNSTGMDDSYGNRVPNFRRMLEQYIERGLWYRIHYHYIGEGLSSSEANFRAVLDIAKEHESVLWIAGMADIHKYLTEHSGSALSLVTSDPGHLSFKLSCATDPDLFDQPLTIEVEIPKSWPPDQITVTDAKGKNQVVRMGHDSGRVVLRFDAAPRTAVYAIELSP